ncbi:MAG: hypothetical protein ACOX3Q_02840 [Clostridia bacterium]|jgi:hypothetical protein|nr:hypothetical protein [Clostridiaceae bacterium]
MNMTHDERFVRKSKKRQIISTVIKYILLFTLVGCIAAVSYIIYFIRLLIY